MSFKDIKGQDRAIALLKTAAKDNRLGHAYIFWGPEGVGKKLAAINFAKLLNCLNVSFAPDGAEPCDECSSCKKINSSNHPDVFLFSPDKEGASIGIDKIRFLIKDIGLKPYEARKKIYIIDNAEDLTREGANAFLKTLEEPPSDSVLILIITDLRNMLPTIISRAQAVKFYSLGIDEVRRILTSEHKLEKETAQVLAHLSSGRLGLALRYNDGDFLKKRSRIVDALSRNTFFDSDFDNINRRDLKAYLDIALSWYRDIMIAKAEGLNAGIDLVNIDRKTAIVEEAKRLEFSYIDNIIKQIISTESFLDINANPKLAMSALGLAALENVR